MPYTIYIPHSSSGSPLFSCSFSSSKHAIAEDISRILDPSYSPTKQTHSIAVLYVDGHHVLYDPDYRDFPANTPPRSAKCHSAGTYYSSTNYPLWADHAVDDEEIDEDSCLRRSPSSLRSSSTTVSRNNFATSSPRISSPPSYHYSSYSSYHSDDILSTSFSYTSPFEEKEKQASRLSAMRKRCSSKKELLDTPTPVTRSLLPTTVEEEDAPEAVAKDDSDECVPTCTQTLQRQWQARSLAFQFGAQRWMKQRVHSLL